MALLRALTSDFLHIASDDEPRKGDVAILQHTLAKAHALFPDLFLNGRGEQYSFSCTPTTHSILHLPETPRQYGPLPTVVQFLTERVVGEADCA